MNFGPEATENFFSDIKNRLSEIPSAKIPLVFQPGKLEVCIYPPFLSLEATLKATQNFPIPVGVGAQNAHWDKSGAFTGEISGPMLKESSISRVLVGHSERRQFFGETDATARKRTESLLEQGFRVILCIGESRAQREAGQTEAVLLRQLESVLEAPSQGAAKFLNGQLILAYEPIWAIGTGLTATPAQAEEAHQLIRKFLWDHFGLQAAGQTLILYGGSVTPENLSSLLDCSNVDGALVGGASLKPENWVKFIQTAMERV